MARVVVDTDGLREGTAWFRRELDVVAHLALRGAPVIPPHPGMPSEPQERDGFPLSFWTYVHVIPGSVPDEALGASLWACHEALRDYRGELEPLAILTESLAVLKHAKRIGAFSIDAAALMERHLQTSLERLAGSPMQPLHGDAHPGNWLLTTNGLRWTDWEDAFLGPVEWDLASLLWNARWLEEDHSQVERILNGYRRGGATICDQRLHQCMIARAAVMCAWYPVLYPQPDDLRIAKLSARLAWLAERQCD